MLSKEKSATKTGEAKVSKPAESDRSVVFQGDGEPKTLSGMLSTLAAFDSEFGYEPDNYMVGGTVQALEERLADLLGKEAAIFLPTGTMANHFAVRALCGSRPRALVQEQCHLYNDTGDCVTRLSNINLVPLAKGRAFFTLEEVTEAVEQSEAGRVTNPIGAMMIESPVRRKAGRVQSLEEMKAITDYCRERGIGTHLDGARLYMMCAATGIGPREYSDLFDTVYVSLYKYFGAPYGGLLAGSRELIGEMYHDRRMFGGSLSSAGLAAALALHGLNGFEQRFASAMAKASELFEDLNKLETVRVGKFENGSNIFPVELDESIDHAMLIKRLSELRIIVRPAEGSEKLSTLAVNTTILRQPNEEIVAAFREALGHAE
ncbi:MAG: aminotransferase class I/II-fold pyridoxal phosphate-dependent enzyme [Chloroflexi bacterium]|nr:aminotransferase class I/II-fold pyridoxal phosphate-dependent enzyme [Chloroflexota bacterium]